MVGRGGAADCDWSRCASESGGGESLGYRPEVDEAVLVKRRI